MLAHSHHHAPPVVPAEVLDSVCGMTILFAFSSSCL